MLGKWEKILYSKIGTNGKAGKWNEKRSDCDWSYRKNSIKLLIIGLELLASAILSLYIPYIFLHSTSALRISIMIIYGRRKTGNRKKYAAGAESIGVCQ